MKEIITKIRIDCSADDVWTTLTDFERYPEWNPFIKSISGIKKEGEQLSVEILPPGGKGMKFTPTILKFEKNLEFRWLGKLLVKGLFDGEHYFLLTENEDGTINFVHGEKFKGLLVGIFSKTLQKTELGFEMMNKALKQTCENQVV